MSCEYKNTLKAAFGRKITSEECNEQFVAIEAALACLEELAAQVTSTDEVIHNWGTVTETIVFDPSLGSMQLVTIEGDVQMSFGTPEVEDPKIIYLLIEDGGSGRFNFSNGLCWSTDSNGSEMDGKPWDTQGLGGDYGSVVICLHDGIGWLYMVFARNDIDFSAVTDITDIYNWR